MDAVHQTEENIDIGICNTHNRVYECYCIGCFCMICPSCLMFDAHKGHQVCHIQEGAKDIRKRISNSAKEGILKFDKTENILLDIRHAKLTLQENRDQIIRQAESYFDQLIQILKTRRKQFLQQLSTHYESQLQLIQNKQVKWILCQQKAEKIVKLQSSRDDNRLMYEAKSIIQGIQELNKPINYEQIQLIRELINDFTIGKGKYSYNELKDMLGMYMKIGQINNNRIKC